MGEADVTYIHCKKDIPTSAESQCLEQKMPSDLMLAPEVLKTNEIGEGYDDFEICSFSTSFNDMLSNKYRKSFRVPPNVYDEKEFMTMVSNRKEICFRNVTLTELLSSMKKGMESYKSVRDFLADQFYTYIKDTNVQKLKGGNKNAAKNYVSSEIIDMFIILNER